MCARQNTAGEEAAVLFVLLLVFAVGGFMGWAFGGISGSIHADERWQKDMVKRGYAEYVVDESGSPAWQWKEAK